ncbi:hypothetical protein ACGFWD_41735 [Streptomyces sp. NPDC048448]|uniref:Uncharacterized protein n=1 Tax=Streptomyces kaempferi TaxID=333725 RepID=A0ABW3XG10_9ACTN|nr:MULTISPECIES: hypothetical protein [unclassified Streptomyces]QIY61171.1 hypothetical protein HEP85_05125 [Streptomyces sp. RPA4-2]
MAFIDERTLTGLTIDHDWYSSPAAEAFEAGNLMVGTREDIAAGRWENLLCVQQR